MKPRRVTLDASVALRWMLDDEFDRAPALRVRDELERASWTRVSRATSSSRSRLVSSEPTAPVG